MKKPLNLFVAIAFSVCLSDSFCQTYDTSTPYYSYYYDYKLANPAFTGSNGKHVITTMFSNSNYQTSFNSKALDRTFYGSYEGRIDKYKTALGAQLLTNTLGSNNFNRIGLFYSRKIAFSERSGLNVGAQLAYQRLVIDYSAFDLMNPDDPMWLGRSKESSVTADVGVSYYSPAVTIGIAAKNLINQIYSTDGVNIIATRKFSLTNNLKLTPSVFYETDFRNSILHLNATVQIKQWILVGGGYTIRDGTNDLSLNVGLNIADWVQVVTHVYSSARQSMRDFTDGYVETLVRVRIPGKVE